MQKNRTTESFYERESVTQALIDNPRSNVCFNLITKQKPSTEQQVIKILDFGCGDGGFAKKFSGNYQFYGVDVSFSAIQKALASGVKAKQIDISSQMLPFENDFFDVVYMGDVIEHLVDPDFAITEARRVLKPDGVLVISTPNLSSWINKWFLAFGKQPLFSEVSTKRSFGRTEYTPVGHLRLFTYGTLKKFLNYYRFEIIQTKGAENHYLPKILSYLDKVLCKKTSIASILVFVAKKQNQT